MNATTSIDARSSASSPLEAPPTMLDNQGTDATLTISTFPAPPKASTTSMFYSRLLEVATIQNAMALQETEVQKANYVATLPTAKEGSKPIDLVCHSGCSACAMGA